MIRKPLRVLAYALLGCAIGCYGTASYLRSAINAENAQLGQRLGAINNYIDGALLRLYELRDEARYQSGDWQLQLPLKYPSLAIQTPTVGTALEGIDKNLNRLECLIIESGNDAAMTAIKNHDRSQRSKVRGL